MLCLTSKVVIKRGLVLLFLISMLLASCGRNESDISSSNHNSGEIQKFSSSQETLSTTSSVSDSQNPRESNETFQPSDETSSSITTQGDHDNSIASQSTPNLTVPPHDLHKLVITSDKSMYTIDNKISITLSNIDNYAYLYRPEYHLQQLKDGDWITLERTIGRMTESAVWLCIPPNETVIFYFELNNNEYGSIVSGRYRFAVEGTYGLNAPNLGTPYDEDASGIAAPILEFTTEFDIIE